VHRAQERRFALGYFESWNLESLQGVIDAAEETRSPVIIGFNGAFLSRPDRRAAERLSWYAALGKAAAQSASVPCGLIFNECPADDWVQQAIELGFNLVMPADPGASSDSYTDRVAAIVQLAHAQNVAVEAELGELPYGSSDAVGRKTDPASAARFVTSTRVNLLAVSVGNVHVRTDGSEALDLALLERIHRKVAVPLVLHGGSGISQADVREAIALGVVKINYGTYLKQSFLAAVRDAIASDLRDPHRLLGLGGDKDIMVCGRRAVRDAVLDRIEWLGCCGQGEIRDSP
jgi:ketose-bisphosphate aldolase